MVLGIVWPEVFFDKYVYWASHSKVTCVNTLIKIMWYKCFKNTIMFNKWLDIFTFTYLLSYTHLIINHVQN